jgi:hypothetical protein
MDYYTLLRNTYLYTKVHNRQNMRYHIHSYNCHHMSFRKDERSNIHSLYYNRSNNPEHMMQGMLHSNIDYSLICNLPYSHYMVEDYIAHQYILPYNLLIHRNWHTGQHILHQYNC